MNAQLEQVLESTIGFHGYYIYNNIDIVEKLLNKEIDIKGVKKVIADLECHSEEYSDLTLKVYKLIGNVRGFHEESYIHQLIKKIKVNV